jgi:hypothetical protein
MAGSLTGHPALMSLVETGLAVTSRFLVVQ